MKSWIKWGGIVLLALVVLVGGAAGFGLWQGQAKQQRKVTVPTYALAYRDDAASVERGRYLYTSRGCADCHGANGAGRVFADDPKSGVHLAGPNISSGPGSLTAGYRPEDWERAIRHGVNPQGRALLIMPSEEFNRLTDEDTAAVIAYVRQLPPASGGKAVLQLPTMFTIMYGFGAAKDAADKIDHTLKPALPVAAGLTVEHGRYIGQMCMGCHGPNLSGGKIPGAPPDWPAAANLTPGDGSAMPRYTDAQAFKAMLRTGKRPDGSAVNPLMPFQSLSAINDLDTEALYLYLKSLPPRAAGGH